MHGQPEGSHSNKRSPGQTETERKREKGEKGGKEGRGGEVREVGRV